MGQQNNKAKKEKHQLLTCKVFFLVLFEGWKRLTGSTGFQATIGC